MRYARLIYLEKFVTEFLIRNTMGRGAGGRSRSWNRCFRRLINLMRDDGIDKTSRCHSRVIWRSRRANQQFLAFTSEIRSDKQKN